MDRGRPGFRQGSSCPAVLRVGAKPYSVRSAYGAFTLSGRASQRVPLRTEPGPVAQAPPYNPATVSGRGLGSSPFARRYWGNLY